MYSIKIPIKSVQKAKKYLLSNNLVDTSCRFTKDNDFFYFPLIDMDTF